MLLETISCKINLEVSSIRIWTNKKYLLLYQKDQKKKKRKTEQGQKIAMGKIPNNLHVQARKDLVSALQWCFVKQNNGKR